MLSFEHHEEHGGQGVGGQTFVNMGKNRAYSKNFDEGPTENYPLGASQWPSKVDYTWGKKLPDFQKLVSQISSPPRSQQRVIQFQRFSELA